MSNTTMLIILAVIFILSGVVIWLTNRGTKPAKVEEPVEGEHLEAKRPEDKPRVKEDKVKEERLREEKLKAEKRREEKP